MDGQATLSLHFTLQQILLLLKESNTLSYSDAIQTIAIVVAVIVPTLTILIGYYLDKKKQNKLAQQQARIERERSAVRGILRARVGAYELSMYLAPLVIRLNQYSSNSEYVEQEFIAVKRKLNEFSTWLDCYLKEIELEITHGLYSEKQVLISYKNLQDTCLTIRVQAANFIAEEKQVNEKQWATELESSIRMFVNTLIKFAPPEDSQ